MKRRDKDSISWRIGESVRVRQEHADKMKNYQLKPLNWVRLVGKVIQQYERTGDTEQRVFVDWQQYPTIHGAKARVRKSEIKGAGIPASWLEAA